MWHTNLAFKAVCSIFSRSCPKSHLLKDTTVLALLFGSRRCVTMKLTSLRTLRSLTMCFGRFEGYALKFAGICFQFRWLQLVTLKGIAHSRNEYIISNNSIEIRGSGFKKKPENIYRNRWERSSDAFPTSNYAQLAYCDNSLLYRFHAPVYRREDRRRNRPVAPQHILDAVQAWERGGRATPSSYANARNNFWPPPQSSSFNATKRATVGGKTLKSDWCNHFKCKSFSIDLQVTEKCEQVRDKDPSIRAGSSSERLESSRNFYWKFSIKLFRELSDRSEPYSANF